MQHFIWWWYNCSGCVAVIKPLALSLSYQIKQQLSQIIYKMRALRNFAILKLCTALTKVTLFEKAMA